MLRVDCIHDKGKINSAYALECALSWDEMQALLRDTVSGQGSSHLMKPTETLTTMLLVKPNLK